ncbi:MULTISPECIES: phage terminase small subunit P27 family [Vibrio]|uniref:phage terminase small subunit P27 family n=1 Tax=Vibrio TaxID=662 RepID=UPI0001BC6F2A|nr:MULTISPECIES: phage terminase small subunit P27 family [Vibrio]MCG6242636.1 phage terminase small subunit P27 family [Vibrio diabolicus]MCR9376046.1 phage terminase small subunit P27 family [Vibrio alginolyticus]MCR9407041.1 phage terminase small subunit P27 family [Vibrio alginolyticus]MCR9590410.1 phage terminase small subunit P27 family [Vibrio alginolyticus]MCR9866283.1 phage terminase small subunit P27 family [Vibrio parahaemolyticus]
MGRPSKPIHELKANGTYRPSVHGSEEDRPQLAIEAPETPRFLNEEALVYFQEIVGYGIDMDIITKADAVIVGLLSNELGEWAELNQAVREEGVMVKLPTATGFMQDVVNPKLKIRDDKTKVILKMLGELGMSPAARSKVQVNEKNKQEKTALGEFLAAVNNQKGGQTH